MASGRRFAGLVKATGLSLAVFSGTLVGVSVVKIEGFTLKLDNVCVGDCKTVAPPPEAAPEPEPAPPPVDKDTKEKPPLTPSSSPSSASRKTSPAPVVASSEQVSYRQPAAAPVQAQPKVWDEACVCDEETDWASAELDAMDAEYVGDGPIADIPDIAMSETSVTSSVSETYVSDDATAASASASGSASVSVSGSTVSVMQSGVWSCSEVTVNGITTRSGDC